MMPTDTLGLLFTLPNELILKITGICDYGLDVDDVLALEMVRAALHSVYID